MKTVLYLIQAKGGLPDIYQCLRKRSWLLLSYRDKTSDTAIYAPNTTWAQGRNLLYEHVCEQNLLYDYYVFLDEDLVFRKVNWDLVTYLNLPRQLRYYYEEFHVPRLRKSLAHQEPGFANFEAVLELGYTLVLPLEYYWFTISHKNDNLNAALQTTWEYDPNFNAISREAFFAKTILPYNEQHDSISWWISPMHQNVKTNHHYPKQVVQNNQYAIFNTQHLDYPKGPDGGELNHADLHKWFDKFTSELGISPDISPARLRGYCEEIESPFARPLPNNFLYKAYSYAKVFLIACGYGISRQYKITKDRLKSMK